MLLVLRGRLEGSVPPLVVTKKYAEGIGDPGLNEIKAREPEADAVDKESMRRLSGETQRKDHLITGSASRFLRSR